MSGRTRALLLAGASGCHRGPTGPISFHLPLDFSQMVFSVSFKNILCILIFYAVSLEWNQPAW